MPKRTTLALFSLAAFVFVPLATLAMIAPPDTATAGGAGGATTTTGAGGATATTTSTSSGSGGAGPCRWLCGEDQCRLDVPEGATCGVDTEVVEVADDPAIELCEPVEDDDTYLVVPEDGSPPFMAIADGTAITGDCDPWTTYDGEGSMVCDEADAGEGSSTSSTSSGADGGDGGKKKKVLITTFCEFHNVPDNPTKRIRERLEKAVRDKCGAEIDLSSVCLKVEVGAIRTCKVKDQIVISLGVCGQNEVRIETEAQNCFVDPTKDSGTKECVVDGGQPTVCGPKPPDGIIPCKVGGYPVKSGDKTSAGTFVCNATYYWTCTQEGCVPYFIHIPLIKPEEDEKFITDMADVICKIVKGTK